MSSFQFIVVVIGVIFALFLMSRVWVARASRKSIDKHRLVHTLWCPKRISGECSYSLHIHTSGNSVPRCPTHHVDLIDPYNTFP